jgi:hypothetical protein
MPSPDKTLMFLDAVADWATARHVEIRIWRNPRDARDEVPDGVPEGAPASSNCDRPIKHWRVTVTLRDSEGFVQGTISASHPACGEGPETFARRVATALDRCCATARRRRIEAYTRADPRRMMQSEART